MSALVNAAAIAALDRAGAFRLAGRERSAPVALARVGAAEWEARRRIAGAAADAVAIERRVPPQLPEPELPAGRIVRVAPSPDARRPQRARFVAERDNTVARETQWRGALRRDAPLAARPTVGEQGEQGVPLPGEEGTSDEAIAGRAGAPEARTRVELARLALGPAGARAVAAPAATPGEGGARRAGAFDPRVLPVAAGFTGAGGGSPAEDRLPGVADGDATLVNTRAFKYAAFYRRVYDAVLGEWRPNQEWDARDPQDRRLGRVPRRAVVDLVLDPEGRLRDTRLVKGSGLEFFDRECLRAVAAAAPFPNPPRGLVGPDGLVVVPVPLLFEWGEQELLDRLLPGR